jgi:NAD(P)-dependent dehydrogenase (short-subunit alcohol dehydrogenase family)
VASVWDYEGTRVIVSGGGGSGMGAAAVTELARLGAEVHVIDLREPPPGATGYFKTDLLDPDAVAQTVDAIGGEIDALFNCAGRPGIKFPDLEVMTVNFLSARHLADLVVPRMPRGGAIVTISSGAGAGWMSNLAKWMPLVTSDGFDSGLDWLKEHPDEIEGGYAPSKEAIIVWTLWAATALAEKGIRINCTSPGPTQTPMMPEFEETVGKDFMERYPIPVGHRSSPEEQAYPLIFLNSRAASFITGENLNVDGGTMGGIMTGCVDLTELLASRTGATD